MYRYGYPTTIPPSGCLYKLSVHSYSPETPQNYQFSEKQHPNSGVGVAFSGNDWVHYSRVKMMSRVRELRKQLGLPVDALAHIAGVSQRTIILWEKYGLVPRNEKTIEKIARALGVEPGELFADEELFLPIVEILGKFERAAKELGTTPEELMLEVDSDPADGEVSGE